MDNSKRNSNSRIPAAEVPELTSWRLPKVGGKHVVRSPFQEKDSVYEAPQAPVEEVEAEPLTLEAIEKIRQQAYEDGFKQGQQEGYAQGEEQGRAKGEELGYQAGFNQGDKDVRALQAQLTELVQAAESPVRRYQQQVETSVLALVQQVATRVVGEELSLQPERIHAMVSQALEALPSDSEHLQLRVHPDDQSLVEELRDQQQAGWQVVADPRLTPGSLMIRGAASYLDYSLEARIAQVMAQFDSADEDADASAAETTAEADVTEPPEAEQHAATQESDGGEEKGVIDEKGGDDAG